MGDILLDRLKANYNVILESTVLMEADKRYLTEAKKRYSHLTESYLLENKPVIENIRSMSVSSRDIMNTFHIGLAAARTIKKSYDAFAIAEHFARTEPDVDIFNDKLNEACKVILELEGEFDPNKTLGGKIDTTSGADQFDPNARIGGQGDFGGDAKAQSKAKPGEIKAKDEKKKGFLVKVKEFLGKAGDIIKKIATSKDTYKALAIGAAMVILGVIAAAIGGWAALGFGAIKGILGLFSIYKGSKELIKTSDFAQGKKGVAGVNAWIKSAKDPKNAARVILAISQVAMGAWGASSAVGGMMKEIAVSEAMKTFNPEGGVDIKPPAPAPTAPAPAVTAPEVPVKPAGAPTNTAQIGAGAPPLTGDATKQAIKAAASGISHATERTGSQAAAVMKQALEDAIKAGTIDKEKAMDIVKLAMDSAPPDAKGRMFGMLAAFIRR